ncbi:MAG: acyltransferase [Candidatus ainarchaeum sp.]|nr:acyltransferase [Candidatus ainarchaeum sp.]
MRQLKETKYRNGDWWFLARQRGLIRIGFNFALCSLSMLIPFPGIKNALLRLTGMRIGENAFIAMGAVLDIFYPELIEIGENAIIGYGCVITAHELLPGVLRTGKIKIGRDSLLGTRSVVLPGVEIGDGAIIGAMSLVNRDVPAKSFYAGVPAKKLR